MKKNKRNWIVNITIFVLLISIVPIVKTQTIEASSGLIVSYSPQPLTAGCVPELVDPTHPFTLYVTDAEGEPVDLTMGNQIDHQAVWNILFVDHYPEQLGQYYWTRTSLHNNNQTRIDNKTLFGFEPIQIDFSRASEGRYVFKNFVANDAGSFFISVYTPDRRRAGSVKVDVVSPSVRYEIINTEDPDQRVFTVPGDPDFILTAADNRLYKITAFATNAQGIPFRGVDKDVNVCAGLQEYARFTPFTTRPANFEFTRKPETTTGFYRVNNSHVQYMINQGGRYHLYLGIDYNMNGRIDVLNNEVHPIGAFNVHDINQQGRIQKTNYYTYYVTTNMMWDNGTYVTEPQFDLNRTESGWGLGSIYNRPYHGGYLFADLNGDGKLNYQDSLTFDSQGRCEFYIFSDDVCNIGGLVGVNPFGNHDVAGGPPVSSVDPQAIERRYRPDYVFHLDFDAIATTNIGSGKPSIKVLNARTGVELGKDIMNPENYDLIYSIENHIRIEIKPADPRDLDVSKQGIISIQGAQHQAAIYGRLHTETTNNTTVTSATMHFTPTGKGENIAWMDFIFENEQTWHPHQFKLEKVLYFDVVMGGGISVNPAIIYADEDNEIFILVTETGTQRPVANATVKITGCGVDFMDKTNAQGRVTTIIRPTSTGEITVEASANNMIPGSKVIQVIEKEKTLFLAIDDVISPTNIPNIVISGRTLPEAIVQFGQEEIKPSSNGSFSFEYQLSEGNNELKVTAVFRDQTRHSSISVVLKTKGPQIMVDPMDTIVNQSEIDIQGRIDPGSTLRANQIPAIIVHDLFRVTVPIPFGLNVIVLEARDELGNQSTKTIEIYNFKEIKIELVIGRAQAKVNGDIVDLDLAPLILNGRTMVPLRFIAEAFGATVEWINETQTITIELDETTIVLQIGNETAFINGKAHTLDAYPEIVQSRTIVPIRFIAEALGAEVEWVRETETIVIKRLI